MDLAKSLGLLFMTCSFLGARQLPEDPVLKARSQRAQAQGINEADLPPVPRSVTEPPPLPPPEIHLKDLHGGRASANPKRKSRLAARGSKRVARGAKHARKSPAAAPKARKRRKA